MADQSPIKAVFDQAGNVIALGQYTTSDSIGVADGGTGNASFNIGGVLVTNGTDSMQEVSRGSIVAGNNAVTITGNSVNSVVGGGNVLISFNESNLDIANTTGLLPSSRIRFVSSDAWTDADLNADQGETSFSGA
tara:strand:+ start:1624 stop:2028 length:405 start_codon:yes stop_codon:yes gene_type:complete